MYKKFIAWAVMEIVTSSSARIHYHPESLFHSLIGFILNTEGGLVDHPHRHGGLTCYGISKRYFPKINVRKITKEGARAFYYTVFWQPYPYEQFPDPLLTYKVFDMSVLLSPQRAHLLLQKALNQLGSDLAEDGLLGADTLEAMHTYPFETIRKAFTQQVEKYFYELILRDATKRLFLKGWMKRLNTTPVIAL